MAQIIPRKPTLSELTGSLISWKELGITFADNIVLDEYLNKNAKKISNFDSILLPPVNHIYINDATKIDNTLLKFYSTNSETTISFNPNKTMSLITNTNIEINNLEATIIETTGSVYAQGFLRIYDHLTCKDLVINNAEGEIYIHFLSAENITINIKDDAIVTLKGNLNVKKLTLDGRYSTRIEINSELGISEKAIIILNGYQTVINYANLSRVLGILKLGTLENHSKFYVKELYNTNIINHQSGIVEIEKITNGETEITNYGKIVVYNKVSYTTVD